MEYYKVVSIKDGKYVSMVLKTTPPTTVLLDVFIPRSEAPYITLAEARQNDLYNQSKNEEQRN